MNRKVFYVLYILIASIANILITLAFIGGIFGVLYLVLHFVFHASPIAMAFALLVSFIAGFVLGFIVYSKLSTKAVKAFHLEPLLYKQHKGGGAGPAAGNAPQEERKYVLPDSAREESEDSKWSGE